MKHSMLGPCVLASLLVLVGCSTNRVSKRPASATSEVINLKVGTIQLPAGFSEKRTGTRDSRMGEISKNNAHFVITYDIGRSSGLHMHPKKKGACLWFKEQLIAGQKCYIGMEMKGAGKMLTISIVPSDGKIREPWTYPANFWAIVKTDEDIEHMKQIALSYLPKSEK